MQHSDDAAALRRQGYRMTPQRLLVLEVVRGGRHLTAEEIHVAVQARQPFVNIATVYRTLQWLHEVGLVAPLAIGVGPLRYEYMGAGTHHHLICLGCGHEQEIEDTALDALKDLLLAHYGFAAELSHLGLTGRCARCRAGQAHQAEA
ncbi:MAG TPA: Fur family transcriptional regulator [Roseiflexaceae bacterium]|nr:Fur family transcriptional regulator [Roseiflexaceae bacterium]